MFIAQNSFAMAVHLGISCILISILFFLDISPTSYDWTAFIVFLVLSSYICDAFQYYSFSVILFSCPSSHWSVKQSHSWKHVLYTYTCMYIHTYKYAYMVMHVLVYMFIFWVCLSHMKENTCPLSF
jgi:hypothetical protein